MRNPDLPSNERLLGELQTLEGLIGHEAGGGLSALIRLVRAGKTWPDLLARHKFHQWLVLPLGQDRFPMLSRLQQQLQALAFEKDHDALTGLRNRRAFDQALAMEIERAARFRTPLSLCILDLDNFKAVNDAHGHPCGDKVIQAMAAILLSETRKIDIAARIGGEEFALILPGTGLLRAQRLLERVLDTVRAERVACGDTELAFTASMGLASYRGRRVPDPDRLVAEADQALYRAKTGGRDRLESAPLLDLGTGPDETLVQGDEKRFLFSPLFESTDGAKDED